MASTRDILASHGLHCTAQRAALYEVLCGTTSHPTAEELFQTVRSRTNLSLATVYSALETFCRVGLARKVPTPEGSCRYDATTDDHVHVRMKSTGTIHDVPEQLGRRLLERVPADVVAEIETALGVRVDAVDIQLIAGPAADADLPPRR